MIVSPKLAHLFQMICVWVDRSQILLPICTVYRVVGVLNPLSVPPDSLADQTIGLFVLIETSFSAKCMWEFILYAL